VGDDQWTAFIEWARRSRGKPAFDLEERDYRESVAASLRDVLDAARGGLPLRDRLDEVGEQLKLRVQPLIGRAELRQLQAWATTDEASLAAALNPFSDPSAPADLRLVRFAQKAGPAVAAGLIEGTPSTIVTVGSLFNFATAPERLPIAQVSKYERLRRALAGVDPDDLSVTGTYTRALEFAHEVRSRLEQAGVPVRDMLDVESLITICAYEQELWAHGGDRKRPKRDVQPDVYLAACMIYKNEAPYLAEWIEFHLQVGVERFFLYDNLSEDDHREVLAPYVEDGIAVVREWAGIGPTPPELNAIQVAAYEHCLRTHGAEARWITIFDVDEFLFSPTGRPVSEMLTKYEQYPGVAVNTPRFGTSGHVTRPEGLVLENYTTRLENDAARFVKSIVDPVAVRACAQSHFCHYEWGSAVDENGFPVLEMMTKSASFELLRMNHYFVRSEEDALTKLGRRGSGRAGEAKTQLEELRRREQESGVRDETIIRYVPAVREALARRQRDARCPHSPGRKKL
jgi:hypothetical protein